MSFKENKNVQEMYGEHIDGVHILAGFLFKGMERLETALTPTSVKLAGKGIENSFPEIIFRETDERPDIRVNLKIKTSNTHTSPGVHEFIYSYNKNRASFKYSQGFLEPPIFMFSFERPDVYIPEENLNKDRWNCLDISYDYAHSRMHLILFSKINNIREHLVIDSSEGLEKLVECLKETYANAKEFIYDVQETGDSKISNKIVRYGIYSEDTEYDDIEGWGNDHFIDIKTINKVGPKNIVEQEYIDTELKLVTVKTFNRNNGVLLAVRYHNEENYSRQYSRISKVLNLTDKNNFANEIIYCFNCGDIVSFSMKSLEIVNKSVILRNQLEKEYSNSVLYSREGAIYKIPCPCDKKQNPQTDITGRGL